MVSVRLGASDAAGTGGSPPISEGQTLTTLHSFEYVDGTATGPLTGVIRDAAGNLYGTTTGGGDVSCYAPAGCGTVFKLDRTGEKTVLHSFTGGADGARPFAGLIRDTAGNLYGTTGEGGTFNFGTVFKVDATGAETVLHSFNWVDGLGPAAGVIRDAIGNLYGTTEYGGASLNGTVFKLDINGTETVLYTFSGGADGESPNAVIRDKAGNFYGTTYSGGRQDNGTIFKVDKTGKKTTLYTFTRPPSTRNVDGVTPNSGLVLYKGALSRHHRWRRSFRVGHGVQDRSVQKGNLAVQLQGWAGRIYPPRRSGPGCGGQSVWRDRIRRRME